MNKSAKVELFDLKYLAILTDAAYSANSSTTKEIIDLISECNKNNKLTLVLSPSFDAEDRYKSATKGIYVKPCFYKHSNFILRFISENIIGFKLAIKYLLFCKDKRNISKVLWISPSIFNIYSAIIIKKFSNATVYLMLRDFFPYWLANVGILRKDGLSFKMLKLIADFQMNIVDKIGVESNKSLCFFKELYPQYSDKAEVLYNWIKSGKIEKNEKSNRDSIKLIYAGNLGMAQGVDLFVGLIKSLSDIPEIEFHLIGRGDGFTLINNIKSDLLLNNIFIYDEISADKIDDFIRGFDIGLVFLKNSLNFSNIPGKAMGYLVNGLPILGSVNPCCELNKIIMENNLGLLDVSGDINNFTDSARNMISDYKNGKYISDNIRMVSEKLFSANTAFQQINNN